MVERRIPSPRRASAPGERPRPRGGGARPSLGFALVLAALLASCARTDGEWLAALEDPDPFERTLAALALCEQAPERAPAALAVLLEGVDRVELGLGAVCAAELERVAPAMPGEILAALLGGELATRERRAALERALAAAGPNGVAAILALADGPGTPRAEALGELVLAIGPRCAPALASALAGSSEPAARAFAARMLGRMGSAAQPALPLLRACSQDPDPTVRAEALEAIARIGKASSGR